MPAIQIIHHQNKIGFDGVVAVRVQTVWSTIPDLCFE